MNDTFLDPVEAVLEDGSRVRLLTSTAATFLQRLVGLIGKKEVPPLCGLVFERCSSIHTMHMSVPIDVLWLGPERDGTRDVVSLDPALRPWRMICGPRGAEGCAEFAAGTFDPANRPVRIERSPGPGPAQTRS